MEVYISRLRGKLEPHGLALRSIRGFGYRLEPAAPPQAPRRDADCDTGGRHGPGLQRRLLLLLLAPLFLLAGLNTWFDFRSADSAALQQDRQLLSLVPPLLADRWWRAVQPKPMRRCC